MSRIPSEATMVRRCGVVRIVALWFATANDIKLLHPALAERRGLTPEWVAPFQ